MERPEAVSLVRASDAALPEAPPEGGIRLHGESSHRKTSSLHKKGERYRWRAPEGPFWELGRKKNEKLTAEAQRTQRRWDKSEEGVGLGAKGVRAEVAGGMGRVRNDV